MKTIPLPPQVKEWQAEERRKQEKQADELFAVRTQLLAQKRRAVQEQVKVRVMSRFWEPGEVPQSFHEEASEFAAQRANTDKRLDAVQNQLVSLVGEPRAAYGLHETQAYCEFMDSHVPRAFDVQLQVDASQILAKFPVTNCPSFLLFFYRLFRKGKTV